MERQFKERLVGATLLVISGVIVIPWLLDGKTNTATTERELTLPGAASHNNETRTIALDAINPGGSSASKMHEAPKAREDEPSLSAPQRIKEPPLATASDKSAQTPPRVASRTEPDAKDVVIEPPPASTNNTRVETRPGGSAPAGTTAEAKPRPAVFEDSITAKTPAPADKRPAREATPVPDITGAKAWAVQVGSFSSEDNAERLAESLRGKNYKAFVMRTVVDDKVTYRVRVGPVGVRKEADLLAAALREDRQPAKVLSHP